MERPGGWCRWCGCTYERACPQGCGWANANHTLCTACVHVDTEWRRLKSTRPPNRLSFFRGFMAGSEDERAVDVGLAHGRIARAIGRGGRATPPSNPYRTGMRHRYWQLGFDAGAKEAR